VVTSLLAAALVCATGLCASGCSREPTADETAAEVRRLASAEPPTVLAALDRLDEFSIVRRAVSATGRDRMLRAHAPVTLLAPRDTAMVQLGPERQAALFAEPNRAALTRALDSLIIPRAIRAEELKQMIADGGGSATVATRAGPLVFTTDGTVLIVTAPSGIRATMGSSELATGNGTVYVLDRWLAAAP
jgi:uncharacterized surface protein with fasciclin (FAS1) repeats